MYLVDSDIYGVLDEMKIETPAGTPPFLQQEQVKACTIDLRLSNVFWEPRSRLRSRRPIVIDTRVRSMDEAAPRWLWHRKEIAEGETITIRPGKMVLGRTHEKFTVPKSCAGGIEGRSSFARMGLAVHCTGEFINPGYRGHMTLQLVNLGPHTIQISPFVPVCQLKLVRLTGVPDRPYTDKDTYYDDDGGPSFWWKDTRIQAIQNTLRRYNVTAGAMHDLIDFVGGLDFEILERFAAFVDGSQKAVLDNADSALDEFAKREDSQRKRDLAKKYLWAVPGSLFVGALGKTILTPATGWPYAVGCGLVAVVCGLYGATVTPGEYLGTKELRKARRATKKS